MTEDNGNKDKDDRSVAEVIVDLTTKNSSLFFKDQYDMPWVRVHKEDHHELIRITGNKFKRYIGKLYYDSEKRVPNAEAINGAASVLQAKAEYDGETIPLSLRVVWDNDSDGIIYDLTDKKWQCVKITIEGWQIINETPVPLFMRYSQMPQIEPSRQYDPDILDRFLQLVNLKREEDKILLVVYIATLFIPEIQHVVLQLHGEQGGAKSMLETFIKELVDPARIKLLSVHKDRMEFIQQIAHNHLVFYDNLKYIPGWLSDEVCRGVTGAGGSKRVLYSDDEDFLYDYRRCFGFNGINLVLTEPDVLDRSITIEQDRIKPINRVQEKLMMSKFYELRAQLLGYIFDILVKALQIHPTLKLGSLPRMGDFALWGEAISRAMGYRELAFINAYDENTGRQNVETIENSPLGQVIARYLNHWQNDLVKDKSACWSGLTSDFLVELNKTATEHNIDTGNYWPKAANSLTRKLKVIMTSIREGLGFDITITRNTTGNNKGASVISIRDISSPSSLEQNQAAMDIRDISSPSSHPHRTENQARNEGKSSEDIFPSEDMGHSSEDISSPENGENRAQNGASEDSEGSEGISRTSVAASTHPPQAPQAPPNTKQAEAEAEIERDIKEGEIKHMTAQEFFALLGYCDTEDHEVSIEEAKAARLRLYEELNKKSLRASKAAAKQEGEV